jgi:lipoprotein-anchoring transpeptidase ErfK/SrfK
MHLRLVAALALLFGTLASPFTGVALGAGFFDFDGRSGGFGWFGSSSSIARTLVTYPTRLKPGSIVISTSERRLYYILGNGEAIRYGIGVGREGFAWSGVRRISAKREWPDWTPPSQMLRRRPDLPRYMHGGVENPLGARAMYLGGTLYRIHGSNEPETIGHAVSSGCIRLTNEDVIDLYSRVRIGATVVVQ